MTTLQVLEGARKLIEKPENWCQGVGAQDSRGSEVSIRFDNVCRMCLDSAIYQSVRAHQSDEQYAAYQNASRSVSAFIPNGGRVTIFNDTHTHPEVLALLDRAIEAERGKQ